MVLGCISMWWIADYIEIIQLLALPSRRQISGGAVLQDDNARLRNVRKVTGFSFSTNKISS